MRRMTFCEDARELFALAEQMADVLAQKRPELGQDDRTEAHLRASIAGARYACTVYAAMCRHKEKSAVARRFLEQADHRRKRALERLHEHVIRSLAVICELMNHDALVDVAEQVLSAGA